MRAPLRSIVLVVGATGCVLLKDAPAVTATSGIPRCETGDDYAWSFDDVGAEAGILDDQSRNRGAAGADFNGDGHVDLFLANPGDLATFFLNRGDGTFVQQTAGVPTTVWDTVASAADFDNDGDDDLFLACGGFGTTCANGLYRNDGVDADGFIVWTDISATADMAGRLNAAFGATWGDYDNDGDLDLFVSTKDLSLSHDGTYPTMGGGDITDGPPPPDFSTPILDLLFRNDGGGVFREVGVEAGVGLPGNTHSSAWIDYDEDGWLDLFVPIFRGENRLFHNNRDGTFTDETPELLLAPKNSFSAIDRDFDQDGHVDLLILAEDQTVYGEPFEEHGLYLSDGAGGWTQAAAELGMGHGHLEPYGDHPMGLQAEDLDGDGAPDVYIGNGNPMPDRTYFINRLLTSNRLLPGDQPFAWDDRSATLDFPARGYGDIYPYRTHGMVFADLDDDGLMDLFEANGGMYADAREPNRLFRNTSPCRNARVRVTVQGVTTNRDGVGAHIRVMDALPGRETWTVHATQTRSSGFNSSRPRERTLGLGLTHGPYVVVVDWPDGGRDIVGGVEEDGRIVVVEGQHR